MGEAYDKAQDELLAIAQVSVALIGFSSLISVFGARTSAVVQRGGDRSTSRDPRR